MSARPRCANCRKAFTPNYRNRTKVTGRQRVCPGCGPVIGHCLAAKRYREDTGESRRKTRPPPAVTSSQPHPGPPPALGSLSPSGPSTVAAATATPVSEVAAQVGRHLVAIAELVNGSKSRDGCEALEPVPERTYEESSWPSAGAGA